VRRGPGGPRQIRKPARARHRQQPAASDRRPPARPEAAGTAPAAPAPAQGRGAAQRQWRRSFASPSGAPHGAAGRSRPCAIRGSGPQGRVVKADIDKRAFAERRPACYGRPTQPQPAPLTRRADAGSGAAAVFAKEQVLALGRQPPYTEKPLTRCAASSPAGSTESKQTVPHFYCRSIARSTSC
jgi:pyruvate dehydrogenase E2 component (dihydrolipoamide acetyltransferase)